MSEIYKKIGINDGSLYSSQAMGKKLKQMKYYFESEGEGMKTVAELLSFSAKVVQNHTRDNVGDGNYKNLDEKTLESSLPKPFKLKIPLFKGEEPQVIQCEFEFEVDKMQFTLVSADAYKKIQDVMETRIGLELTRIAEMSPEIPQIQAISEN